MFKVQEMRELIRLIDKSTINEFTYEKDDSKIKIKKTATGTAQVEAPVSANASCKRRSSSLRNNRSFRRLRRSSISNGRYILSKTIT